MPAAVHGLARHLLSTVFDSPTRPWNLQCFWKSAVDTQKCMIHAVPVAGAGPGPILGASHQASSDGILMHIVNQSVQSLWIGNIFVVTGPRLPESVVRPICVPDLEPLQETWIMFPQVVDRPFSNGLFEA